MKWILYNIVPIGLMVLTGWLAYLDKAWGWGLLVVACTGWIHPKTCECKKKEE